MDTTEVDEPPPADGAGKKYLSVRQAAFIGVGAMVGAGIFALLGAAGEVAGAAVWLSFVIAGFVAVLQGYSFAKLGARYPSAGGLLEYVAKATGNGHFTGVTAWLTYLANAIVTAMVAVSFGSYATSTFAGENQAWIKVFAALIIIVMTGVNVVGSRLVAGAQTVIVYVVLGILTFFSVVTLVNITPSLLAPSKYPPFQDIISSVALTFFAFLGFGIITFTAKDLAKPSRQLPKAMFLALGIATVIYVAIALGVFGTLTVDKVISSGGTAIAVAAEPTLGRAGYWLMTVTALFATAGATNAGLYPAQGLSERLAETGQFPPLMARKLGGRASNGLLIQAVVCMVLAVVFKLDSIASIGSAVALVIFTMITAAHLRIRSETGANLPMLVLAIVAAGAVFVTFVFTTLIHEPASIVTLAGILVLSIGLDYGWKRSRADQASAVKVGQLDRGHHGTHHAAGVVTPAQGATKEERKAELKLLPGQRIAEPGSSEIGGTNMAVEASTTGRPDTMGQNWYAHSPDEVAAAFGVGPAAGLSATKAAELLQANGPNALPEEKPKPGWRRFLDQYTSYMQIILIAAAVVSLLIKEWSTGVLLLALTVLNAVIGLRQEGKAESAMNALKSMMKATARVRRDGSEAQIPADQVVVGDVVLIAAGDEVPADGRIIAASALQIDESALTGESVPAAKDAQTLPGDDLNPGDQTNMAFMNTPVTHGSGTVIVTATGTGTELGKISRLLAATAAEQSPLDRELNRLTLWIAAAAGLTMIVMFALGRARGQAWDALFISAVSLAIAAIPEALPTVSQWILSVGAVDLAKRNAIVKDLPSVETLGFTSAINSDKTGTLTMNQMTAVEVVNPTDRYTISGIGYGLDGQVQHAAGSAASIEDAILPYLVASDAKLVDGKVVGDPTEGALLVLGYKAGMDIDETREKLPRLATLPFDPTYKLMATFNSATGTAGQPVIRCFVKGAAPAVMARAATALSGGTSIPWDTGLNEQHQAHMERMEGKGRRVMASATRDLDPAGFDPAGDLLGYVTGLQLTSLVGMVDPARDESKDAVASAQAAHIRVRMVTGDDVITGAAIAKQVGIPGEAILGADFAALSESERLARIDDIGVLGRVAPEHKVLLADTLKKKGDVVAMTGDGVNDAPAIKAADIGIAMGSGTEVAKNAGRMILSDDNFATIVFAVEQGRKIYDNLTKYIRFVLVLLVVFVLTFLGATLFNIASSEPFTPAQVLWVHFFVNAPFGFALGFDKESPGLMARTPRPRGASVLTKGVMVTVGLSGLAITIGLLSLIELGQHHFGSVHVGQSIAFTSFALCLIVAALECRSETGTVLTTASFDSKQMNWAMLGEFVVAVLVTQMDVFNRLLGTVQINLRQFGWALVPAVVLLALWELGKLVARRSAADRSTVSPPAIETTR